MTREFAYERVVWGGVLTVIDEIFDYFEAQLKAKDQEIDRLEADCNTCKFWDGKLDCTQKYLSNRDCSRSFEDYYTPKTFEGQDAYVKMLQQEHAKV